MYHERPVQRRKHVWTACFKAGRPNTNTIGSMVGWNENKATVQAKVWALFAAGIQMTKVDIAVTGVHVMVTLRVNSINNAVP